MSSPERNNAESSVTTATKQHVNRDGTSDAAWPYASSSPAHGQGPQAPVGWSCLLRASRPLGCSGVGTEALKPAGGAICRAYSEDNLLAEPVNVAFYRLAVSPSRSGCTLLWELALVQHPSIGTCLGLARAKTSWTALCHSTDQ